VLYNGLIPGLQHQMCLASVRIGMYDLVKEFYTDLLMTGGDSKNLPAAIRIARKMMAGALAVPTVHSTNVVKVTNRTFNGCHQSHQPHIQRMSSKSPTVHSTDVVKVTNRTFNGCRQSHQPHIQRMLSKSPTKHSTDVVKVTNQTFNGCRQSHQPHIQRMLSKSPTPPSTDFIKVTNRIFNECRQSHQPHIQWMSSKSLTAHSTDVVKVTNRTFNGCHQSPPTAQPTDVVKVRMQANCPAPGMPKQYTRSNLKCKTNAGVEGVRGLLGAEEFKPCMSDL
jgi:CRISPR/Cas system-associated protein endoribonuclease Cas2